MSAPVTSPSRRRLRLRVSGAVQGVGMRPFLFRSARELGLDGWIRNDPQGVTLELEGEPAGLRALADRLRSEPPPRAVIKDVAEEWLDPDGMAGLRILPSDTQGDRVAAVLPDLATCPACLGDIGMGPGPDPIDEGRHSGLGDRRAGYPFTNCTDCGPRFSIIRALPYDRPNTTMAGFELCPACRAEYEDPMDRRFHAQPTACPACGPHLLDRSDGGSDRDAERIRAVAAALRAGEIVAVKGLGGFHLVVDAGDEAAVDRLRERKHRPTKPLAVMVRDLAMARTVCDVTDEAAALLASPEAPILLLPKRGDAAVADGVAPGNPYVGIMLPYTPLHHLLLRELDRPVVATSGNLSDEPICTGNDEALDRLAGIADRFLLHDRPIERPVDDSVLQWSVGAARPVRRSRGYAPLPVEVDGDLPPILAVGGHLKNTIALSRGSDVFMSQHIGDLETPQARDAFERVIADFLRLYEVEPEIVAHDAHPDYASTAWATGESASRADGRVPAGLRAARRVPVQHHHAHLAACLADNRVTGPALGVVWDGTGLGPDGTVWGGEFLLGDARGYRRVGQLLPFRLPGGDAAVLEPRRVALALAHAGWGDEGVERLLGIGTLDPEGGVPWSDVELGVLGRVLRSGFRAPWTTSAGRLFDGVSAAMGLRAVAGFEGEAAMALEYAVDPGERASYPFSVVAAAGPGAAGPGVAEPGPVEPGALVVDWRPAVDALLGDIERGRPVGAIAAAFHNGLVDAIVEVAARVGAEAVALSGGCFQNVVLTDRTAAALERSGQRPLLHRRVPANDGGLALGQVAIAAARAGMT